MPAPLNSVGESSCLSDARILLVDPERTNRTILAGMIEDIKPAQFMVAKSVADARLALADRFNTFNIIILAIKNPPTSGFHFLQEIRGGGIPGIPRNSRILLFSPPPNHAMIELAGSLDADGLLTLPISAAAVSNALSKALKREREAKTAEDYLAVNLPNPVIKKPKKNTNSKAWVVWKQKEKEKTDFLLSFESVLEKIKEEEKVEPT